MVYVNNGQVYQSQPWSINRIIKFCDGIIMFFIFFFKTLVGLDTGGSKQSSSGSSGWGSSRGSGGGGGGGGRPFGPGGSGGGPRFRTMRDINPPTVGGCPGGACGM